MKKKIGDLTLREKREICNRYKYCCDCPLDEVVCNDDGDLDEEIETEEK
jgi:hypothetical protein